MMEIRGPNCAACVSVHAHAAQSTQCGRHAACVRWVRWVGGCAWLCKPLSYIVCMLIIFEISWPYNGPCWLGSAKATLRKLYSQIRNRMAGFHPEQNNICLLVNYYYIHTLYHYTSLCIRSIYILWFLRNMNACKYVYCITLAYLIMWNEMFLNTNLYF